MTRKELALDRLVVAVREALLSDMENATTRRRVVEGLATSLCAVDDTDPPIQLEDDDEPDTATMTVSELPSGTTAKLPA